jgi:hypothetical protein
MNVPSVDMERNIVSKSSAGDAGVCFFVFSFEISRYGTLESMSSRDFMELSGLFSWYSMMGCRVAAHQSVRMSCLEFTVGRI